MTDRTHPDSGRIITGGDLLLQHDAEIALMYEELRAAIDDGHESMTHADALAEIAAIRAENIELRTQLEAVGAGGVSGPLMGKPQEMPDLSALTERGAKAWAGVDARGLRDGAESTGSEPVAPEWWRKRADEIEAQVAATGSTEAMRCYTDMRTLLQAATNQPSPTPQPALDPADVIAGALQTSRGHAMELMQQAVDADRAARAPADSVTAPAGGEIDRLRAALVYVAFALHGKPQYMLAEGIALIDGDTVRVSRDGWTVEASINPARATPPAQTADSVTAPAYSIDADPQGIRARVADAITGALAFGAQGANPPPSAHWLAPFWEMAREEASRNRPVSSDTLYLLRRLLSNQHTLTGSEFREELTKIVGEATQAADSVLEEAAREAIDKVLALFPFNAPIQTFTIGGGPHLTADGDTEFYSVKRVLAFLTEIKTTLAAARKQGGQHGL